MNEEVLLNTIPTRPIVISFAIIETVGVKFVFRHFGDRLGIGIILLMTHDYLRYGNQR
jgi:hypothetical protein